MNKVRSLLLSLTAVIWLTSNASSQPITFSYTGAVQSYVVPIGIDRVEFELFGAGGGNGLGFWSYAKGGTGALVTGSLSVSLGDTLYIFVGGAGSPSLANWGDPSGTGFGGWNGGGRSTLVGAGGGGATDIRLNATALADRIAAAGGGGGVGQSYDGFNADVGQNNGVLGQGSAAEYGGGGGGYLGGLDGKNWSQGGNGGTTWADLDYVEDHEISGGGSVGGDHGFVVLTAVPEPSTYALLALGAIGAIWFRLRRKKA